MSSSNKYSPEVRERAVRMVLEHQSAHDSQWAAIGSIAEKIGCTSETLRKWVRQAERDQGRRPGLTSAERERLKALERENRALRTARTVPHPQHGGETPPHDPGNLDDDVATAQLTKTGQGNMKKGE